MSQEASFPVTLTKSQAQALLQLLHIAVQAKGLEVAAVAVTLHNILDSAYKTAFPLETP